MNFKLLFFVAMFAFVGLSALVSANDDANQEPQAEAISLDENKPVAEEASVAEDMSVAESKPVEANRVAEAIAKKQSVVTSCDAKTGPDCKACCKSINKDLQYQLRGRCVCSRYFN